MLFNRLQKRFRHLKKWSERTGVGVFRLYDKDIPEIPLVLDFYGDFEKNISNSGCLKLNNAAVSGALYKRPYEKDEDDETQWLSAMKESISNALDISVDCVFLKQRRKQRGASQYEKINHARVEKIISEGGLLASKLFFKINLSDYLDTGLFIDRRLLREMIRAESADKKVLNLFSYTGSFSVYAAAGGAASTDSVDISNTYLNWARENFSLNRFSAEIFKKNLTAEDAELYKGRVKENHRISRINADTDKKRAHRLIRADVLEFLERAVFEKKRWDIIIVDPPVFSNSKKMNEDFDLNRDIVRLLSQCLKLLECDGKIFLSVNVRRSAPSAAEIEEGLNRLPSMNVRVTDITDKITDEDFKGRKIPKAFLIEMAKKGF